MDKLSEKLLRQDKAIRYMSKHANPSHEGLSPDEEDNESVLSVDDDDVSDDENCAIYPGANMSSNTNDSQFADQYFISSHADNQSLHSSRFLNNIYVHEQVLVGELLVMRLEI